jgi:uncharacterized membrane protein
VRQRPTAVLWGSLGGGLIALTGFAVLVGRNSLGSLGLDSGGHAQLALASGALYLAVVLTAVLGGAAVSGIAYGLSSKGERDVATRFELSHVLPFGIVAAIAGGYAVFRAGIGFAADAAAGVTTITVRDLAVVVLLSGLVAGAITSWITSLLEAKQVVGLSGEAVPESSAAMLRQALRAVTGPMLAIVVIAGLAIGLSQLLLAVQGAAAVAIFAAVGAIVLLGAAAAAHLGGPGGTESS